MLFHGPLPFLMKSIVITFGNFDIFHIGHLNILRRAKSLGDYLVVGVSTDLMSLEEKNKETYINEVDRAEIVKSIRYVDEVFFEHSLKNKVEYIKHYQASVLIMGDDWVGGFDWVKEHCEVNVVYLPRTPNISTTSIKESLPVGVKRG